MKNPESVVNNLFLIGAGFTKSVLPDSPLNKELLHSIINYNPKTLLRKYQIRYHTDDIELLLTRMDLETIELKSERLKQDRHKINKEIAEYFQQFRFGKHEAKFRNTSWLQQLAKSVFTEYDAIVSLNYDCLLDGALDYYKVWSPSKGYGAADVKVEVPDTDFEKLPNPKNILIYKIHGSENFQTCGIKDKNVDAYHIGLTVNEEIYPESGKHSNFGVVEGESYIIAPSFVKTFYQQIERMMIGALCAAAKAKNFVVIGCSLRPEDNHLWFLLNSFVHSLRKNRRMIIVDRKPEAVKRKITTQYQSVLDIPVDTLGQGRGLDDCAVQELISKLHSGNVI